MYSPLIEDEMMTLDPRVSSPILLQSEQLTVFNAILLAMSIARPLLTFHIGTELWSVTPY